jgi:hypothetical protein
MDYPLLQPPQKFCPFGQMSEHEANEHFRWFTGAEPSRIDLLTCAVREEQGTDIEITESSLPRLWAWFVPHIRTESASRDSVGQRELAASTLCLAVDIGFFLARLYREIEPSVHWTLWKRNKDYYYQRPVLTGGGRYPHVPHDPVVAAAWKVVHGRASSDELSPRPRHVIKTLRSR